MTCPYNSYVKVSLKLLTGEESIFVVDFNLHRDPLMVKKQRIRLEHSKLHGASIPLPALPRLRILVEEGVERSEEPEMVDISNKTMFSRHNRLDAVQTHSSCRACKRPMQTSQTKSQHGGWAWARCPTPNWGAISNWRLLGKVESIFL